MIDRSPALVLATILVAGCSRHADSGAHDSANTPAMLDDGIEAASPAAAGLQEAPLDALTQDLIDASFPNTTSVLFLKDGRLVFERYFRDGGPAVLNDTRSAMKSVTALAILAALADGELPSLDEPAFARLADLAPFAHDGPLKQQITLADFLTMSSSLDCNDWEEASPGNEENMYPLDDWSRWTIGPAGRSISRCGTITNAMKRAGDLFPTARPVSFCSARFCNAPRVCRWTTTSAGACSIRSALQNANGRVHRKAR